MQLSSHTQQLCTLKCTGYVLLITYSLSQQRLVIYLDSSFHPEHPSAKWQRMSSWQNRGLYFPMSTAPSVSSLRRKRTWGTEIEVQWMRAGWGRDGATHELNHYSLSMHQYLSRGTCSLLSTYTIKRDDTVWVNVSSVTTWGLNVIE